MRTTFTNSECCHVWTQKTQEHGRGHSIFFEGDTIYSYGHHFPMARHADEIVLITTRSYSVSTSKHQSYVLQACHHIPHFYVYDVTARSKTQHRENLAKMREEYENLIVKASRARVYANEYAQQAEGHRNRANEYAAHFKLGTRIKPANVEQITTRAKRQAAKERRERKKQAKRQQALYLERVEKWRNHETNAIPWGYSRFALLRLSPDGETVQTSQGATFPASHARRALPLVMRCANNSQSWERNGEQIRLGQYRLDSIDENGTVRAGCHTVEFSEVRHLAALLGV